MSEGAHIEGFELALSELFESAPRTKDDLYQRVCGLASQLIASDRRIHAKQMLLAIKGMKRQVQDTVIVIPGQRNATEEEYAVNELIDRIMSHLMRKYGLDADGNEVNN